jgi:hypothetical protein
MTRRRSFLTAARPLGRLASVALVIGAGACGGSASAPVKAPTEVVPTADTVSIGDTAAAQGGLASLGGGSNRSNEGAAQLGSLHLDLVDKSSPVKVDGMLNEWPARTAAKTVVKGAPGKTAFAVALQHDASRLYVGGEVTDDAFVRTSRFAEGEDHASIVLGFPVGSGGALAAYEVALYAGKPGETSGVVKFASGSRRGQEVSGARIVEAPTAGGYSFEASIPWSAFPEARAVRVGLRGLARYYDADGGAGGARTIVATGPGEVTAAAGLPPLPTDPEQAMMEGLLVPKGLMAEAPRFDVVADVAGDGMKERIAVFGSYLTICGPGYRGGREYFFRDLGADVLKLEARQVTGRAKEDLVLRRRFEGQGGVTREWFEVWSILGGSDEPVTTFGHEIAIALGPKHLDNAVHLKGRDVEVSVEPATGWDPSAYREPIASDVQPLLFPWGGVKSRVFRFDGKTFAKVKEVTQTPTATAAGTPSAPLAPGDVAPARPLDKEPPTPTVRKGADLSAQVFDLYKRDHGGGDGAPRFDLQVNVSGDARAERVVLVNKDIVVFGPGFKGGAGYATLTLQQFDGPSDVKDLTARDMDGDGDADLVVRGVRRVTAQGSSTPVEIEAMFIYAVRESAITRVFAIETAREQGGKRVQGLVQFVPAAGGKSFEIDVRPGMAKGWTEKSYPWQQDAPGGGALEPLLLPWGNVPSLRYAWNGTTFSPR